MVSLFCLNVWSIDKNNSFFFGCKSPEHVLIFFKYYDPQVPYLSYAGLGHFPRTMPFVELFPFLCEKAGLPKGTPLLVYEEEYCTSIKELTDHTQSLQNTISELMDGDILVYQRNEAAMLAMGDDDGGRLAETPQYEFPTIIDYINDLMMRVEVLFCDKNSNDPGFVLELSLKMTYNQIAQAVAMRLGVDPFMLQFFKNQRQVVDWCLPSF